MKLSFDGSPPHETDPMNTVLCLFLKAFLNFLNDRGLMTLILNLFPNFSVAFILVISGPDTEGIAENNLLLLFFLRIA